MAKNRWNYNPYHLKLEHPPRRGDQPAPDRDRQKLANQKQRLGGGKQGRVGRPIMLD